MLRYENLQGRYAYFSAVKIYIQKNDIKSVMHWQKEMLLHARQKQIKKNEFMFNQSIVSQKWQIINRKVEKKNQLNRQFI